MALKIYDNVAAIISLAAYGLGMATTIAMVITARLITEFIYNLTQLPEEVFTNKFLFMIFVVIFTIIVLFYVGATAIQKFFQIGFFYYNKMQEVNHANKNINQNSKRSSTKG